MTYLMVMINSLYMQPLASCVFLLPLDSNLGNWQNIAYFCYLCYDELTIWYYV